jgi:hypothetical protein
MQTQSLTGVPGSLVGGVFSVGQERPVLVVVRRMLQCLTRPWWPTQHGGLFAKLPSMRRRRAWARRLDQLLDAASRNPSAWRFPHPDFEAPLQLSTRVVWPCRPELLAIMAVLQEYRQPISSAALQQLKAFLTDPGVSALFGTDPGAARQAAQRLQHSFTGHPEPRDPPRTTR